VPILTRSCAAEQVGRAQAAEFFERRVVDGVTKMLSEKEAQVRPHKGDGRSVYLLY